VPCKVVHPCPVEGVTGPCSVAVQKFPGWSQMQIEATVFVVEPGGVESKLGYLNPMTMQPEATDGKVTLLCNGGDVSEELYVE
jgi:hypothetical protein